jgi:hypothetical protein
LFASLPEHSEFIRGGSLGYSATATPRRFDGMQLRSFRWHAEPLEVARVASSFFDDRRRFPAGSIAFDSALLMRDIEHEWHGQEPICCDGRQAHASLASSF